MSEWWTYRLSDFLMFSPAVYHRQFELLNQAWWPLQLVTLVAGLAMLTGSPRDGDRAARAACAGLGLCWLFVAGAFHLQRYAPINTAAPWFAGAFALQGALLLAQVARRGFHLLPQRGARALALVALLGWPLLAPLMGRPLAQAEVFGLAPDPTALATLAVLAMLRPAVWWLWALPLAWCTVSALTLWTMDEAAAALLVAAAAAAAVVTAIRSRARSS